MPENRTYLRYCWCGRCSTNRRFIQTCHWCNSIYVLGFRNNLCKNKHSMQSNENLRICYKQAFATNYLPVSSEMSTLWYFLCGVSKLCASWPITCVLHDPSLFNWISFVSAELRTSWKYLENNNFRLAGESHIEMDHKATKVQLTHQLLIFRMVLAYHKPDNSM